MNAVIKPKDSPVDPCQVLTQRERLVLENAAEGLTNAAIGAKLFISSRTVESHRANLMRKLNVRNLRALIRYAVQKQVLPQTD